MVGKTRRVFLPNAPTILLGCSLALTFLAGACKNKSQSQESTETTAARIVPTPDFNADSAYAYVANQLAFGPRVPNTEAHRKGGDYLIAELKRFGCTVTVQEFTPTTYDGKKLAARNIIGSINPGAAKRILLAAHWDSRPVADEDSVAKNKPVPGANDGASGVGVLLELARNIQQAQKKPTVGIDIIFFDAEDWGNSEKAQNDTTGGINYIGFCLGSRYWAQNKHKPGYSAYYGILLDMVGAKDAKFFREGDSMQYAPSVVNTVWQAASDLGYNRYFIDQTGQTILDDHIAVNTLAKIPMIDIIHTEQSGGFFPHWHTAGDDLDVIDRTTLKAVGRCCCRRCTGRNRLMNN